MIGTIAAGLAGGVVAGMLGVGGGVLFVPALVVFMNLSQHHAEATSLLAIIPVALVGAPAVVGVVLGAELQQRVRSREISALFALALVASAVELVLK